MKTASRLVLAIVTLGSCALAGAQPFSQSDQERRDRNREEAIAHHEHMNTSSEHMSGAREEMHEGASNVRAKTHHAADKTRSFTHRQLDKVRNFGERQQRKYPAGESAQGTNKAPSALGK